MVHVVWGRRALLAALAFVAMAVPLYAVATNSSAAAVPSGLVGAWSFDETSGTTAADVSGKGNNGSVSGATRVAGKYGNALSFDGVNDVVTVADSASLDLTNAL